MSLTQTYSEWAGSLTPDDREAALIALGELVPSAGETAWDEIVRLEPNRSLPLLVSPDCGPGLSEALTERFLWAHRLGGFFGFFLDRMSDGQVEASRQAARTCHLLGLAWHDALTSALGHWGPAAQVVSRSLQQWRQGTSFEEVCLRDRTLEPFYAQISRLKNGWVAASTVAMLKAHGGPRMAEALARSYDYFLFALQCRDDVDDAVEDASTRGSSIPEALSLPHGALLRAVPLLLERAQEEAHAGGLATFASWLEDFRRGADPSSHGPDFHRESLLAMIVAARMDQELATMTDGKPPRS